MWSLLVACSLTLAYGQCQQPSQCGLDNQAFLQLRENPGAGSAQSDIRIPAICPSSVCRDEKVEDHTSANLTVLFAFHCPEEGLKKLHQDLMEISNPQHERYGNWLSKQEADSLCDPDKTVVESWLRDHNLTSEESWPRHLRIKLSTAEAEMLFKTSIHRYRRGDRTVVQAEDYFLPRKVNEVISAIYGLNDLPLRDTASPPAPPTCQVQNPPPFLQQVMQLLQYFPDAAAAQQILCFCGKEVLSFWEQLNPDDRKRIEGSNLADAPQQLLQWLRSHVSVPESGQLEYCIKQFYALVLDFKNEVDVRKQWVDNSMLGGIPNQPSKNFLAGPDVIKQMYQVPTGNAPVNGTKATQSVLVINHISTADWSSDNQYSIPLAHWYQNVYSQQATTIQVSGVNFDDTTSMDVKASESNLDIQMMVGVGPNIPTDPHGVLEGPGNPPALKTYFSDLLKMEDPPLVNSVSYGMMPFFSSDSPAYVHIKDSDKDLALLAARGITVVAASGDGGAGYGWLPSDTVHANSNITGEYFFAIPLPDNRTCNLYCALTRYESWQLKLPTDICGAWLFEETPGSNGTCTMFSLGMPFERTTGHGVIGGPEIVDGPMAPMWPGMSPWVVSVGSTAAWRNGEFLNQWMPERATNWFGSGGGFMCPYSGFLEIAFNYAIKDQRAAVEKYQNGSRHVKPSPSDKCQMPTRTRVSGRGRIGHESPIFAAIISHLNVERLARGMPPMGFINPWLYQNSDVFNDVTEGANNIGRTNDYGPQEKYGYSAAEGWDPVTGLGTPNYPKMLQRAIGSTPKPTEVTTTTAPPPPDHKRSCSQTRRVAQGPTHGNADF
eukprot:s6347_g4.t1